MSLWLMRHPRVLLAEPTCYGINDVPLDAAHIRQCAARIAAQWPEGVRIVTSEMRRTQAVAQRAVRQWGRQGWTVDARLNEMDFGQWELTPWRQIPKEAVDAWVADFPRHRFGGAESVQQLIDRVARCLRDVRPLAREQDVLWICHAGVMRALQFLRTQPTGRIQSAAQWPQAAPGFGELQRLPLEAVIAQTARQGQQ